MTSAERRRIESKLERFIVDELLDLHSGGDPLASGDVDSLGLEQLVEYIEEEFGLRLRDEELVAENFESIPILAAFVEAERRPAVP
jgi:acyl carrier protein